MSLSGSLEETGAVPPSQCVLDDCPLACLLPAQRAFLRRLRFQLQSFQLLERLLMLPLLALRSLLLPPFPVRLPRSEIQRQGGASAVMLSLSSACVASEVTASGAAISAGLASAADSLSASALAALTGCSVSAPSSFGATVASLTGSALLSPAWLASASPSCALASAFD